MGVLGSSVVLLMAGCISHHETVYRDVERRPVEFENDVAARIFYETVMRSRNAGERTEVRTDVSLPVVFDHKKRVVSGPNVAFNEAVTMCDTNKDGRVTVQEARIYAELKRRKG
ncbi:MAG: hypothetical protein K0Q55_1550 [Verrucomicrobia bacterium]|nr:hypothetical protein [Verrucomicrobiota bacterium]